ncbi:MAG: hypothetical protein EXR73_06710 [Myxococcales bacterium]|nr:hypothetical protein [Myxococcales bacterium]
MTAPRRAFAAFTALDAWWFGPAPAERLAAVRILVGSFALLYLVTRAAHLLALPDLPALSYAPVGLLQLLGDDTALHPTLFRALVLLALPLAACFTAGVAHRLLAPLFAATLAILFTTRSSFGMVFHTDNLLLLHVAVLALAPAADAWRFGSPASTLASAPAPDAQYGWPLRALAALTCLTYLLAGVAKLRIAGFAWLSGDGLRDQVAVDNLRALLLGASPSPLALPLLAHAAAFQALAVATLALELFAPLALVSARAALVFTVIAWSFHVGVAALMFIVFPYPLAGVAFAPLFACERPLAWLVQRAHRRPRGA